MNPKHFYHPTPKKWRIIGDFALGLLVAVQPVLHDMPVTDQTKYWVNLGVTIMLVSFKFFTNLFKEEEETSDNRNI